MFNFIWLDIDSSWQTSDSTDFVTRLWLDSTKSWLDSDSTRPSHDSTWLEKNSDDSDLKGLWLDVTRQIWLVHITVIWQGWKTYGLGTNTDRVNMAHVSEFLSPKIDLKSHQNETLW